MALTILAILIKQRRTLTQSDFDIQFGLLQNQGSDYDTEPRGPWVAQAQFTVALTGRR